MPKKYRFPLIIGVLILLALGGLAALRKSVTVEVDGETRQVMTFAWTVEGALRSAGIQTGPNDRVEPAPETRLTRGAVIRVSRAVDVSILYQGVPLPLQTGERVPARLLELAGVPYTPGDLLLLNGQQVLPDMPLPPAYRYALQIQKGVQITLIEGDQRREIVSAAATLGKALWEAGVRLQPGDRISIAPDRPMLEPVEVRLFRAAPLTIQVGDQELHTHTAAGTVGLALAEAGISLQGLDRSEPPEDAPVPAGGKVRVVRVREETVLTQTAIPFTNETQPDPDTELGQKRVIQAGVAGIQAARERVRYEDGQEVGRSREAEWVASQPKAQIVGTGTKVVVKSLDTPDGPVEYYRAVSVYATSYSPCRQGMGKCSKSTSSGIPLTKGVVAVTLPWYRQFAGQRVYIPGYGVGVIGDVGGGIPGKYWVDLGYDEENFVNWHDTVTMYFLTPVPENVTWSLP